MTKVIEQKHEKPTIIHIPRCCIDMTDDCPHVRRDPKHKKQKNIAL